MVADRMVLSLPERLLQKALRIITASDLGRESTTAYMKAFRKHRPEAVLAEYGTTGVLTMEACRRLAIPLIVHFHGYDASEHRVLKEHAETYPILFAEAAAIIAVSRTMQRKLVSLGAPPEKVNYNPYGVDCERFGGASPARAAPVFLAVGRFVEKKAPQITLMAFAQVWRLDSSVRLRMIGDGPLLDECRALAKELAIEDAV